MEPTPQILALIATLNLDIARIQADDRRYRESREEAVRVDTYMQARLAAEADQ